jgi:hypothetical protein
MPTWDDYGNQTTQAAAYDRDHQQPLALGGRQSKQERTQSIADSREFCLGLQRPVPPDGFVGSSIRANREGLSRALAEVPRPHLLPP